MYVIKCILKYFIKCFFIQKIALLYKRSYWMPIQYYVNGSHRSTMVSLEVLFSTVSGTKIVAASFDKVIIFHLMDTRPGRKWQRQRSFSVHETLRFQGVNPCPRAWPPVACHQPRGHPVVSDAVRGSGLRGLCRIC